MDNPEANSDSQKKYKILIVDDDDFLLNMYVSKFQKHGHDIAIAKSSEEALGKLRDGYQPDILLLDVVLPDMDGLDLLETACNEKLVDKSLCIMFTNQSGMHETDRAKKLGVAGYIVKASMVPSEVVAKVHEIAKQNNK